LYGYLPWATRMVRVWPEGDKNLKNPPPSERRPTARPWWLHQPSSGVRRIALSEPCDLGFEASGRHGIVWNLSVLGAYVLLEAPLPALGETMRLSFSLPEDATRVECQVRVAWVNPPSFFKGCGSAAAGLPPGCGFAFIDLPPSDRERIAARVDTSRRSVP
jgi:PilZ domain